MSRFGDLLGGESVTPPVVDTAPSSVEPVVEEAPRPEEEVAEIYESDVSFHCLLYTSPSPRDEL